MLHNTLMVQNEWVLYIDSENEFMQSTYSTFSYFEFKIRLIHLIR